MSNWKQHRKNFAIGLSLIATAITLASASASYAINLESFQDWGEYAARILAFLTTAGIEAFFGLCLYGISYALTGRLEKALGVLTLGFLLAVMACNFTIHRQIVKGFGLSPWQENYYQWAGSLVLFVIVLLIIAFTAVSYEARERRLQRDIEFLSRQKGLEWKKEALESESLAEYLEDSKAGVYEQVRKTLQLPAAPATSRPVSGFARYGRRSGEQDGPKS